MSNRRPHCAWKGPVPRLRGERLNWELACFRTIADRIDAPVAGLELSVHGNAGVIVADSRGGEVELINRGLSSGGDTVSLLAWGFGALCWVTTVSRMLNAAASFGR